MKPQTWFNLYIFLYGLFLASMGAIAAENYLLNNGSFIALSLATILLLSGITVMALAILPRQKEN